MPAERRFHKLTLEEFLELFAAFPFRRRINAVHMHHTWKPDHAQYRRDPEAAILGMWRSHTQERGFSDIAQHITIGPDGEIWTGRHWDLPPASATGHNGNRIAGPFMFEMIGNFDIGFDPFGGAQLHSALEVIARVQQRFGLAPELLRFHNQMSSKTCPGTEIDYNQIVSAVRERRQALESAGREANRFFGPEADRSREVAGRLTSIFFEPPADRATPEDGELEENETASRRTWAVSNGRAAALDGGSAARAAFRPEDLEKLRSHVVNLRFGELSSTGIFTNSQTDVERIFREAIPAATRNWPRPVPLLLYAHGGLVSEAAGLAVALDQVDFWLANRIYPVFFVWETGFLETLHDLFTSIFTGRRALLELGELENKLLESVARPAGVAVWGRMKRSAEVAVLGGGGGLIVAREVAALAAGNGGIQLHAAGHSAGSIFHAHLLPALLEAGLPRVKSLHFLAPAVNIPTFQAKLAARIGTGKGIDHLTMYTMHRSYELADKAGPYNGSLLYLVRHSFEQPDETPILGLEEDLRAESCLARLFGLQGGSSADADVVFSVTPDSAPPRNQSRSTSHGGFDNDSYTMESVARSILESDQLLQPFPAGTRDLVTDELANLYSLAAAPAVDGFAASAPAVSTPPGPLAAAPGRGRSRALCVGINAYPPPNALSGCVADARNWGAALGALGYQVEFLLDGQATRENILNRLSQLLRGGTAGDSIVFQYAGHGTQVKDLDGDETDGQDEAICPVDFASGSFIIDDDFRRVFDLTPDGVSVTCFMDCCHSGTITRLVAGLSEANARGVPASKARFLTATPEMERAHEEFRRGLAFRAAAPLRGPDSMKEVLFSACLPSEVAYETGGSGDFTSRAVPVLETGLTNDQFLERVVQAFGVPARQHPNADYPPGWGSRPLLGRADIAVAAAADGRSFEPAPADIAQSLRTIAEWLHAEAYAAPQHASGH